MCLIAFSWEPGTATPLVLVANRDEYFRRPAAPMARWPDQPDIIAGRDLEAMGTWLGIEARRGRFAALTNIRRPVYRRPFGKSRGRLVAGFLQSDLPPAAYLEAVCRDLQDYPGFNLLVGAGPPETLYHLNSEDCPRPVTPGLHALSNAGLDSPGWPKVDSARRKLARWLERGGTAPDLALLLDSRALAPVDALPATGVDPAVEHRLSAEFITMEDYGTRCGTGVIWGRDEIRLAEVGFDAQGRVTGQVEFRVRPGVP